MNLGGGNSQPQTVTTTQNKDPWSAAQPHLQGIMGEAAKYYGAGTGFVPYAGQTQAGIQPHLQNALDNTWNTAATDSLSPQVYNAAQGLALNMQGSQGMTPAIANAINNGIGQNVIGQYNNVYSNPETADMYRASYNQASGQENPHLQGLMDMQGRKIGDQVNSTMSGAGRYGSGAHTNVLSRNLAEAQLPLLAQDYQNRQQQQLQAAQGMLNVGQQQLAATAGAGQGYQAIADAYGQGLNRAGQFAQLAPAMEQAKYFNPGKLSEVGNFYQGRAQNDINSGINFYNATQAYPWEQLQRYSALTNQAGSLGGSQVTTQPNLNLPVGGMQSAFGGALAGAGLGGSIFGPVGAGVGALGGGLLGLMR